MTLTQLAVGAGIVLVGLVWLRWDLRRHPYAACGRCGGSGKHRSVTGLRFGECRRCDGSGKKTGLLPRLLGTRGGGS